MSIDDTATALLDAHVAWTIARLQGPAFEAEVTRQLDAFLADITRVRLKHVIRSRDIHATVHKYAVQLELGGAMPELVGSIVRRLYGHKIHERTKLGDLMPDKHLRELLDKLLEFTELREGLIRETVHSEIFSSLISELLYQGILDYTAQGSRHAERLPGAKSAMKLGRKVVERAQAQFGDALTDRVKAQVRRNTESSLKASERHLHRAFESDRFRQAVLEVWADMKGASLADIRKMVDSLDVEELFVILYEFWLEFREEPFFSTMVNAGIDCVLEQFGDLDLATLLQEIGISRDMMIDDALRFAPPVIAHLQKKKLLDPFVRRLLEGFYSSDELRAALAVR